MISVAAASSLRRAGPAPARRHLSAACADAVLKLNALLEEYRAAK